MTVEVVGEATPSVTLAADPGEVSIGPDILLDAAPSVTLTANPGSVVYVLGVTANIDLATPEPTLESGISVVGATGTLSLSAGTDARVSEAGIAISATPASVVFTAMNGSVYALVVDRSGDIIQMTIANSVISNQPGILSVGVGNATPNALVYFYLNAQENYITSARTDSSGSIAAVNVTVDGLSAGGHLLYASEAIDRTGVEASAAFTTLTAYVTPDPSGAPTVPPMISGGTTVKHWVFQSYAGSDSYIFAINPSSSRMSFGDINLTHEHTTANSGQVVSWEGAPRPTKWSFSGTVLTEAHYRAMESWCRRNERVYITDHFARRYLVRFEEFNFSPVRDVERKWHHTYEATVTVLSGTGVYGA